MIAAVVLSAGESSRMGQPKALLRIDGQTFIEHIVGALKDGGIGRIIVVLGFHADDLRRRISHCQWRFLSIRITSSGSCHRCKSPCATCKGRRSATA